MRNVRAAVTGDVRTGPRARVRFPRPLPLTSKWTWEATSEYGEPLGIVHRDVAPQNVMVGVDGVARVFDFGVAKAAQRSQTTHDSALQGKIGYMSPEQLHGERIDRRSDICAARVVLWEALVGERLFLSAEGHPGLLLSLTQTVKPPSLRAPGLSPVLDDVHRAQDLRHPALDAGQDTESTGRVRRVV